MKTIITATAAVLLTTTAVLASPDPLRTIGPVTYNEPTSEYGTGNGQNFVALPSPTNGTNGQDGTDGQDGATGPQGDQGDRGDDGQDGQDGQDGADGATGADGVAGADGSDGRDGVDGVDGSTGASGAAGATGVDGATGLSGVAPLGSLSLSVAEASFYGDGIGFGLSASNYSDLEGSVVLGFYLDNDWRLVVGVTTDFNDRHAVSVGVGISF